MKLRSPYQRIKEIDARLEPLELREKEIKSKTYKHKPQELEKIESEIFFLVIERNHIQETINWFEKMVKIKELKKDDN